MNKSIDQNDFIKLIICLRNIAKYDPENDKNDDIMAYNFGRIDALNFVLSLYDMMYDD